MPGVLQRTNATGTTIDLRRLPYVAPKKQEREEFEEPELNPTLLPGTEGTPSAIEQQPGGSLAPSLSAPAPTPNITFDGLDFVTWGAGHPPDPNGDVGPAYYIQTVNTSIGIYDKTNGNRVAAFTFNTFMSQGHFGNLCDTNNGGDPVVLYDSFEDRWIITDFAFTSSAAGSNVFQCFAVSKTGDPVSGGWYFYSFLTNDNFPDYPKFGVWSDGIYQAANLFGPGGSFAGTRVWAYNKAQMYRRADGAVRFVQYTGYRRLHAAAFERAIADRYAAGRYAKLLCLRLGIPQRSECVCVACRLESNLVVDVRTCRSAACQQQLGERQSTECDDAG